VKRSLRVVLYLLAMLTLTILLVFATVRFVYRYLPRSGLSDFIEKEMQSTDGDKELRIKISHEGIYVVKSNGIIYNTSVSDDDAVLIGENKKMVHQFFVDICDLGLFRASHRVVDVKVHLFSMIHFQPFYTDYDSGYSPGHLIEISAYSDGQLLYHFRYPGVADSCGIVEFEVIGNVLGRFYMLRNAPP